MGNFLQKQGQRLLNDPAYAYFLTALLAVLPFTDWLALSIIALISLRKGYWPGLKLLLVGLSLGVIVCLWRARLPHEAFNLALTFFLGYFAALLLKAWSSWTKLLNSLLLLNVLIILGLQLFARDFVQGQFETLISLLKSMPGTEVGFKIPGFKSLVQQPVMADYLLGIQALGLLFSALSSLAMARQIQALLYYPGGFREEFLAFRASPAVVLVLVLAAFGAYQQYPAMISLLPVLLVYAMVAGMLVLFHVLFKKKDRIAMLVLFLPLILVPYVMLPAYVLLGSLDSLFDFRRRLPSQVSK